MNIINMRHQRDMKLSGSDWTQLQDSKLSEEKIQEYKDYRQKLRDIPQDYPDGSQVVWPEEPS